jgi:SynChlorMet cassette radical SAM/SPASM protein ScmE
MHQVMNTPRRMDLEITGRCNLKCSYCSHFTSYENSDTEVPKEQWFQFIDELEQCSVLEVSLTGGEPFVREDIEPIITKIVSHRMRFTIISNGTLITDKNLQFIASTKRCNCIQISLDGSIAEIHDSFRGQGTFEKAINSLRLLQQHNIKTSVRVTIHRLNYRDLSNITELLLDELGLSSFSTNSAAQLGMCKNNSSSIQLDTNERSEAMEILLKLSQKYPNRISASSGPLAEATTWSLWERLRADGKMNQNGGGFLTGCSGAFDKLAVRADGILTPCVQIPNIQLGKINEVDLRRIWKNHPELVAFRNRAEIPLSSFEYCNGCNYIHFCTGNCPALYESVNDKVNPSSPEPCYKRFLEQGGRLPKLQ